MQGHDCRCTHRPARQGLINEVKAGGHDPVVVWKLDRCSRSTLDVPNTVTELDAAGIAFVSAQDNIDMTTPQRRLMVQLLPAFSEFEGAQLRSRVVAGLKRAKRTGKNIGRPTTEAARAPRIAALVAQGVSLPEIARRHQMPFSSIHRLARMETRPK